MRKQVGLIIDGIRLAGPNTCFWPLQVDGTEVGKVTSAVFCPRLKKNIALAMVSANMVEIGMDLNLFSPTDTRTAKVVGKPFFDPHKQIPKNFSVLAG